MTTGTEATTVEAAPREAFFSLRVRPWRVLGLGMAAACAGTLAGYLAPLWWVFENAACFRVQYSIVLALGCAVFWFGRRRHAAVMLASFAAVNCVSFLPLYLGGDKPAGPATLRVMYVNVHTGNRAYQDVIAAVADAKPHVVVFSEIDRAWAEQLQTLRHAFPFYRQDPREDNFGLAVYSRVRPDEMSLRYFGEASVPTAVCRFGSDGSRMTLIGTHPVPPANAEYVRMRDEQMALLAKLTRTLPRPLMLIGDLNMTSDSPVFQNFLRETGLRDTRAGFGIQATWPTNVPVLWIAIDHCLVSDKVLVHDRRVGPGVGSDHLPLTVDVSVRE